MNTYKYYIFIWLKKSQLAAYYRSAQQDERILYIFLQHLNLYF